MGKGGAVLGIIGILLGVGGIGFAFIVWNTQNSIKSDLAAEDIWYQYDEDLFYSTPIITYNHITNMSIVFDLVTPASIHILFTCSARIIPSSGYSDLWFYFAIDDVRLSNPYTRVGTYQGGSTTEYYSVSLQHFIEALPVGTYNISVMMMSEYAPNFIRDSSLTIQSSAN